MDTHSLPLLKIAANDKDDLTIFSAHLQDSLIPLHSLYYDHDAATFSGLCNRFCWEHDAHEFQGEPLFHRVHSGLTIRHVKNIHHKGFDHKATRTLNLLSLMVEEEEESAHIHFFFSGQSEIRLSVDSILCHLGDLHHPWPTHKKPQHPE